MKVIFAVMCTTQAVAKIRPEKNSGLYGIFLFFYFLFYFIFLFFIFFYLFIFFQALFSLLPKWCTSLRRSLSFMSLSAVQIYDLHIFLTVKALHGFTNSPCQTLGNVQRTVWRICIMMFGCKGLTFTPFGVIDE